MKTFAVITSASALLAIVGCVSQQTYDKTRAEANDLTRALEMARLDVTEMERRIDALQALNKKEDARTAEIRAAIQVETDSAPIFRQRADDRIAALQTQLAHLLNQGRQLRSNLAEIKQEGASFQAVLTQSKQDLEESPLMSLATRSVPLGQSPPAPSPVPLAALTSPIPTPVPQVAVPQPAPIDSPAKPSAPTRPLKGGQVQTDDSWTGMIKGWVSGLWGWIFG